MSGDAHSILATELECGMCAARFQAYEGMRKSSMRGGPYICKPHQDEFDSIDWDVVREREAGMA